MAIKRIRLDTGSSEDMVSPKKKIKLAISESQPVQFDQQEVREQPQQDQTYLQSAGRIGRGLGESAISGAAGVPKGLAETGDVVQNISSRVQDYLGTSPKQSPKQEEFNRMIESKGLDNRSMAARIGEALPSSKDIKETIGSEYTKPRNEYEELGQNIAETFGSMLFPLPGAGLPSKGVKSIAKGAAKLGTQALGGDVAKFLTQKLGGSKELGEAVKLGTMLAVSFGQQPGLEERSKGLLDFAEKNTPKSVRVGIPNTEKALDEALNLANKGNVDLKDKVNLRKYVDRFGSNIVNDKASLAQIISEKRDISRTIREDFTKGSPEEAFIFKIYDALNKDIKKNPEVRKDVAQALTAADEIYKGVKESERAVNFIKNNSDLKNKLGVPGMISLAVALGPTVGPIGLAKAGATTIGLPLAAAGATKLGYSVKNLLTNPSIRKETANIFSAALKENSPLLVKHAKSLVEKVDKMKEKEESGWQPVNEVSESQWEAA